MIARTDKGNSIVILPTKLYESKTQDFLHKKNFITSTKDPTNTFQKEVRNTVKGSRALTPKNNKWRYINLKQSAPSIKGLIKLHNPGQPIRPVVNWRNAPAYKLSRLFTQTINSTAPLPNTFNVRNTADLLQNLQDTPLHPHYTLPSPDTTNFYSNIPIRETKSILTNTLGYNQTDPKI